MKISLRVGDFLHTGYSFSLATSWTVLLAVSFLPHAECESGLSRRIWLAVSYYSFQLPQDHLELLSWEAG